LNHINIFVLFAVLDKISRSEQYAKVVYSGSRQEFEDTKGSSESVNRRSTANKMAKGKSTKGQTTIYKAYI